MTGSGNAASVSCLTGEGSGGIGGLLFRLNVCGQWSNPWRAITTKYAAPSIASFVADNSTTLSEAGTAGGMRGELISIS